MEKKILARKKRKKRQFLSNYKTSYSFFLVSILLNLYQKQTNQKKAQKLYLEFGTGLVERKEKTFSTKKVATWKHVIRELLKSADSHSTFFFLSFLLHLFVQIQPRSFFFTNNKPFYFSGFKMALAFNKYPFLKALGLEEENDGVYNGHWFGSGMFTLKNLVLFV